MDLIIFWSVPLVAILVIYLLTRPTSSKNSIDGGTAGGIIGGVVGTRESSDGAASWRSWFAFDGGDGGDGGGGD